MAQTRLWAVLGTASLSLGMGLTPQHPANVQFQCTPRSVTSGQSVTLHLPATHGGELGVQTPDKRILFIALDSEPQAPVATAAFKSLRTLELPTATAQGLAPADAWKPDRIFTVAGTYRFVVSDNLETEDEGGANLWCIVRFSGAK